MCVYCPEHKSEPTSSDYINTLIEKARRSESLFSEWMTCPNSQESEKRYEEAHQDFMAFIRHVRMSMLERS